MEKKSNIRFYYTIDKYGLVTIVITLNYLYSVLPFRKELTNNKALQIQIEICAVLWNVINFLSILNILGDCFAEIGKKRVNAIISTYLCIQKS